VPDSAVVAGLPRISGAAADRLPIKDSLGAARRGFFDERKGIRKAAYEAAELLTSSAFRVEPA
jgi:hypothetical protein